MFSRVLCVFYAGLLMAQAQSAPDPAAIAKKAVDLLVGGKYSDLFQMFSPDGQAANPEAALARIGAQIKTYGAVESEGQPSVTKPGANSIVVIPVKFATQNINFTVAVTPAGQVALILQRPGETVWQRPPYSKPDAFRERAVVVGTGDWKLPATLTAPAGNGPFPGVVLVHDSGPNDRDETFGVCKPFKDLAEGLASRGIAVLRYEKRARQYSARMAGMTGKTIDEETTEDAVAAIALMRTEKDIDPQHVYLLGHSLGGYIAPRIAAEDGKLAGIIIFAGNARPLEDLIVDQAEYMGINGKQLEMVKALAARVKALEPADADAPPIMNMPVSFLLDLKGYDPVASAKKLPIPMLILQGERDFQVNMKDFNLWKSGMSGRKDITFHSYPALNHLFVAGTGKSTEAEYRKPGHVDAAVIDDVAKWLGK